MQEILEEWVAELPAGSPIPSERDLAEHFGVARMTVRLQLDRLAQRGLLYRHRGRGTFVAEQCVAHTEHLTSFTHDMRARGLEPGSRLLGIEEIRAGAPAQAPEEVGLVVVGHHPLPGARRLPPQMMGLVCGEYRSNEAAWAASAGAASARPIAPQACELSARR